MDIQELNQRVERIYNSISILEKKDPIGIKKEITLSNDYQNMSVDFGGNKSEAELKNSVFSLVSNIASIKDYIKAWCIKNGKPFNGESIINSNKNVAVVHDLWNIEKHYELDKPPRSGCTPKIRNLRQSLQIFTGPDKGSHASFTMDPVTGEMKMETGGSGSVSLRITGEVIDENGKGLGDIFSICSKAIEAWEAELKNLGV
jgi:hypothetical protein